MSEIPPVAAVLSELAIPYRTHVHKEPIKTIEQAAEDRGQKPDQIVRSILFRIEEGKFVMVLVAGSSQISWPKLRAYLSRSRLTLATENEVLLMTGYQIGAVSPFGLPQPIRVLVDNNVFLNTEISIGSGVRGTAIILNSADLSSALGDIEISTFIESK